MSLALSSSRRIFSKTPVALIHFSPFPGRFIRKAQRTSTDNYNSFVVTNKVVDSDYRWQDDKWYHPTNVQGASLWTSGIQVGRLIAAYYWESEWDYESEDPAMIWQIPAGNKVARLAGAPPKAAPGIFKFCCQPTLLLLSATYVTHVGRHNYPVRPPTHRTQQRQQRFPRRIRTSTKHAHAFPRASQIINILTSESQHSTQVSGASSCKHHMILNTPIYPNEGGGRVVRLYDWLTADNPLAHRHPEILRGWNPDVSGVAYGELYTWETAGVVWRLRKRGI
ncbi:MAG: hypothetical protein Q9207_003447 [Kuettlingeria erythrocarpa]